MKQWIIAIALLYASTARAQTTYVPVQQVVQLPPAPGGVQVTSLGAKCDDMTDDTAAINAAAQLAAANVQNINYGTLVGGNYISLPAGKFCKITNTITLPTGVGYDSNGARLDATALPAGVWAMDIKGTGTNSNSIAPLRSINIDGNPNRSGEGLLVERPNAGFYDLNVANFDKDLSFGSNTYVDTFTNVRLSNANFGIYNPGGLANEGEEMTFNGGAIASTSWAIYANGGEWVINGMSIDSVAQFPVAGTYGMGYGDIYGAGAVFRLTDDHIEKFYGSPLLMEGKAGQNCSTWSNMTVVNTWFITDQSINIPLIDISGGTPTCGGIGPYATIRDVFLGGFSNGAGGTWITGNYAANGALCNVTNGTSGKIANVGNC